MSSPLMPRKRGWAMILVSVSVPRNCRDGIGHGHLIVVQVAELDALEREIIIAVGQGRVEPELQGRVAKVKAEGLGLLP